MRRQQGQCEVVQQNKRVTHCLTVKRVVRQLV